MQNLYPLFERNRILKKELLWSLRDYSFAHLQLEYQEYSQGILWGCDITVRGDKLVVSPGIIKYGPFICLMMEEEMIEYTPLEQMQFLKIKAEIDRSSPDYIAYRTMLLLDQNEAKDEDEFELCRFHLRKGAQLRSQYKGFSDMITEYDTINLIYGSWGGLGGGSMAPAVTRYFARTVLESGNSQPEDRSFAYLCLSQPGAVPAQALTAYARHRSGGGWDKAMDNLSVYQSMCSLIDDIQKGEEKGISIRKEKRRILVD
ncbi:MAG: hypothetical protein LBQ71_11630 [Hungatella sp.]|jgi:hypothetical protein|nr:hypothetical protein [Hungatella sp.]